MDRYQAKFPFFSINQKAYCGYERDNIYSHVTLSPTSTIDLPVYSKQFEHDLFQVYFGHIHPFFPILDKYNILQSLLYDTIPPSLRWAVMAIVTSHFSHINRQDSNEYYQHAINRLDHTPTLLTVQTLLLLYKHQELNTPIGVPITQSAINFLNQAQSILSQWNSQDEYVCRAKWILFITLSFSNIADERLKNTLNYCSTPNSLPSLTEAEQYDEIEISTTCNLIHLCNIALIYSQTISLISEGDTLFNKTTNYSNEFIKLSNGLNVWKSTLPQHISHFINQDPTHPHPHHHHQSNKISKSTSYIIYLCLIHDILDLLITSNQPNQFHNLSKKALSVCFRAHEFTLGDMQPNQFSRLASIQGSRMVSFGLTLSVQAQTFNDHMDEENDNNSSCSSINDKNIEKLSCFSIAYPILEQIALSPQLYMTIHTFHAQLESKKQLEQHNQHQHQQVHPSLGIHGRLDSNSSSSSSGGTSSTNSTMDSSYFYNTPNTPTTTQQQQSNDSSNEWQDYTSYTSNHQQYHQLTWADQPIYQQEREDVYNIPVTPNFEERNNNSDSPDMHSPSSLTGTESYFDVQPSANNFGPSVMVLSGPYDFISHHPIERAYNSKCCNNKN